MPEISQLLGAMISYYGGDPERIQHFVKVHDIARTIGILEGVDKETLYVLEAAAAVHDIGIRICELKYGKTDVRLQEQEGPALANDMLNALGFEKNVIERVCWLVANNHPSNRINSWDHQILVEADSLITLYEENASHNEIQYAYEKVFLSETGKLFCRKMFNL